MTRDPTTETDAAPLPPPLDLALGAPTGSTAGAPKKSVTTEEWWQLRVKERNPELRLVVARGLEWDPSTPDGQVVVTLGADGAIEVRQRRRGKQRQWRATLNDARLGEILAALEATGFPEPGVRAVADGVDAREVGLEIGIREYSRLVARSGATPPWEAVLVLTDGIGDAVRGLDTPASRKIRLGEVSDAVEISGN